MAKITNRTVLKQIGIQYLEELKVPSEVLHDFDKSDILYLFGLATVYGGKVKFLCYDPVTSGFELSRRIDSVEENGAKVFAITRDFLPDYGEFYSFLL